MRNIVTLLLTLVPFAAYAQAEQVPADQAIPSLMYFILFAALAIGIGGLIYFLRSRSNRAAMKRVINE